MPFNNRILVIDDDSGILEIFREVLVGAPAAGAGSLGELNQLLSMMSGAGGEQRSDGRHFLVDTATQGEEGFRLLQQAKKAEQPYSVVFVDMRMPPGWDGVRTIREIHAFDPYVQLVIVTAYSDASVAEIVKNVGFTDRLLYLKKPFDDEEIMQLADSLSMRWNLEHKVQSFIRILEGIVCSLSDLQLGGDDESLRPFLQKVLLQLSDFLDTPDVFLAKIDQSGIRFKVGIGKFANGITAQAEFREVVKNVFNRKRVEDVFRVNEYVVMPIILRNCKNVVVGVLHERQVEGVDQLLQVLAENAAKIFDQSARLADVCRELEAMREREKQMKAQIASLQNAIGS